jgi:uncharacterized membrane protein HdeD (DUF308 family)
MLPREFARYWWIPFALGVLGVIAGILVLVYPGRTLLLIELVFGFYLIALGVLRIAGVFMDGGDDDADRWLDGLIGVLAIIAGLLVLTTPGFGLATLAVIFAIYLMAGGILWLYVAMQREQDRGWNLARGVLGLVAGFIVIVQPGIGLVTLAVIAGIYFLLVGAAEIAVGLAIRRAGGSAG